MRKTVKLGEIAKAVGGNGFPKKYQGYKNKDIPFFKVSDMNTDGNEKFMLKSNNFVDVNDLKEMKAKLHPAGTIIFPKIGGAISTNKKRILTKDAAFDNNVMGVVPSNKILPEYLYKFFLNIDLYELSNKAALPSIKNGTVNDIDFVLPPLAEQERIVAKLDAAFAKIDGTIEGSNKKINELISLKSAILKQELQPSDVA
jgi:Restriction endonuclease S subunits|tara:strand:+ start:1193 stop:1792 length:600 start_codon:yes stop_codon:yes gene_type:complete